MGVVRVKGTFNRLSSSSLRKASISMELWSASYSVVGGRFSFVDVFFLVVAGGLGCTRGANPSKALLESWRGGRARTAAWAVSGRRAAPLPSCPLLGVVAGLMESQQRSIEVSASSTVDSENS